MANATEIPIETAVSTPPCAILLAPAVDTVATVFVEEGLRLVEVMVVDPEFGILDGVEPEVEVGVNKPLHTTTSVPWVLVVADKVDGFPSTIMTESAETEVDADADPETPEVWTVYVLPPTTYSPPGPTLTVFTETGVTVVVRVVVLADKLEVSPLTTTALPEEARE